MKQIKRCETCKHLEYKKNEYCICTLVDYDTGLLQTCDGWEEKDE